MIGVDSGRFVSHEDIQRPAAYFITQDSEVIPAQMKAAIFAGIPVCPASLTTQQTVWPQPMTAGIEFVSTDLLGPDRLTVDIHRLFQHSLE